MIGRWKVGRTIGRGCSGKYTALPVLRPLTHTHSHRLEGMYESHDTRGPVNMQLSRLYPSPPLQPLEFPSTALQKKWNAKSWLLREKLWS